MLCHAANRERLGRTDRLASTKALNKESIESVPECAGGVLGRDDPAVDRAVRVANMLRLPGSKLEHQQGFAVPTENLGTLVLVSIPGQMLVR
jgi:hypothetical protein